MYLKILELYKNVVILVLSLKDESEIIFEIEQWTYLPIDNKHPRAYNPVTLRIGRYLKSYKDLFFKKKVHLIFRYCCSCGGAQNEDNVVVQGVCCVFIVIS